MARYIDADKLLEQVNSLEQLARKRVYDTPTNSPAYERYATQYHEREKMLAILKAQPIADVVPKSEYDNLKMQFDALDCECDRLEKAESEKHDKIIEAKAEVARKIFEEIEKHVEVALMNGHIETPILCIGHGTFAELKKKYAEVDENE